MTPCVSHRADSWPTFSLPSVCGPTSMNLSVRSYVREMIDPRAVYEGDYASDITIHTETFSW